MHRRAQGHPLVSIGRLAPRISRLPLPAVLRAWRHGSTTCHLPVTSGNYPYDLGRLRCSPSEAGDLSLPSLPPNHGINRSLGKPAALVFSR